ERETRSYRTGRIPACLMRRWLINAESPVRGSPRHLLLAAAGGRATTARDGHTATGAAEGDARRRDGRQRENRQRRREQLLPLRHPSHLPSLRAVAHSAPSVGWVTHGELLRRQRATNAFSSCRSR